MAHYRMESEEEALFRSYPYALYFVQSPSTVSHANSNSNAVNYEHPSLQETDARLALSRYSSSIGSNNSFQSNHKKKYSQEQVHVLLQNTHKSDEAIVKNFLVGDDGQECGRKEIDGDEDYDYQEKNKGWIKYFSFSHSNSWWWVLIQLSWRFMLSLMIALLVFYVAAKPPPPKFSIKVGRIPHYRLGEGIDASGVTTKLLSSNISIDVIIDNHSKVFALHLHPPTLKLIFGHLTFATSEQVQGREVYAEIDNLTLMRFTVGTKSKPMYGAGRNMQDLLESGKGLPLVIKVGLKSRFIVVWGIFEPKYHHQAQCLVTIDNDYDKKHKTQVYNSTCVVN